MAIPSRKKAIRSRELDRLLMDNNKYEISPWGNIEVLAFEQFMEDIEPLKEKDIYKYAEKLEEYVDSKLIKPFMHPTPDELSSVDIMFLFVKIYELSKGPTIELTYTCDKCGVDTNNIFDIKSDKNVITKEYNKPEDLKLSPDIVLKFVTSNTYSNNKDKYLYFSSYISEIILDEECFVCETAEETYKWVKDNLTVEEFDKLMSYIAKEIPKIEFKMQFKCQNSSCDNVPDIVEFPNLPDFSLRLL